MSSAVNFFRRLDDMLVFRKGDQRAPHKPLYLLYCIAGVQAGKDRLQPFDAVQQTLKPALRIFGPRTETAHPEYPFWRLQHDKLAEVFTDGPLTLRKSNSDPTVSSLREQNARGGLLDGDHEMLCGDLQLQSLTVHKILDAHFPASIHDEVVRFFGLTLEDRHARDRTSDLQFRSRVLSAYSNSCALTGFNLDVAGRSVGVEAAHIFWPQSGGNDEVSNGLAMSTLHRKLFHLGLFSIDLDYKVVVASGVSDRETSKIALTAMSGKEISLPKDEASWPNKTSLTWHQRWVFRG
jgi:putative restriction endonuclease